VAAGKEGRANVTERRAPPPTRKIKGRELILKFSSCLARRVIAGVA
jgi:hypothetical protein